MFIQSFTPWAVLLMAPFVRPVRFWPLFMTYIIPVVPIVALWDGMASCLRTYSVEDLEELISDLQVDDWVWTVGKKRGVLGLPITYLIGEPAQPGASGAGL